MTAHYRPQPHRMTPPQAAAVAALLTQRWPWPELAETGLALLETEILDTGLTVDEATLALQACLQQQHRTRPGGYELRTAHLAGHTAAIEQLPAHRRPWIPELVATPDPDTVRTHITTARQALEHARTA
jgi:hypothetical protein